MLFIKYAAFHLQQVGLKKQKTTSERSGSIEKETIKSEEADIAAVQSTSEKGTEEQQQLNSDEAKKIVESITESITHGEKPDVEESTKVI
jgi:protein TIF31